MAYVAVSSGLTQSVVVRGFVLGSGRLEMRDGIGNFVA